MYSSQLLRRLSFCLLLCQAHGSIHSAPAIRISCIFVVILNVCAVLQIHNSCFFQGMRDIPASCLIANPPYIPAPDNQILMPALHGGVDGANLTRVSPWASAVVAPKLLLTVTHMVISTEPLGAKSRD